MIGANAIDVTTVRILQWPPALRPPHTHPHSVHHEDIAVSWANRAFQQDAFSALKVFPPFLLHLHLENSFYTSSLIKKSLLLGGFP